MMVLPNDDIFVELCAYFRNIFFQNMMNYNTHRKKYKVPRKRRHWVIPLFKSRDIPLMNNGVTQ